MKFSYLLITIVSLVNFNMAQLNIDSAPQSIIKELKKNVPIFTTPSFDTQKLIEQDILDSEQNIPYRFGYNISTDINFFDYAVCDTLDNGDKVFRLKISSPQAYSINFIFNHFY